MHGNASCPSQVVRANPVNPISGCKILAGESERDFTLPAAIPLAWQRIYSSGQRRTGVLGQGWSTPLSTALQISDGQVIILDPFQRDITFALPRVGEALFSLSEKITLERTGERSFELFDEAGLCSQFAMLPRAFDTAVLVGMSDANDNRLRVTWNARQQPETVEDSAGRVFVMDYISHRGQLRLGGIGIERDAVNYEEPTTEVLMRYSYDELGNLSQVINRAGEVTRQFAYMNHIMIEHSQPGGLVSRYEYDEYEWTGKVTRNWTNNGRSWNFRYLNGETLVYDNIGREELFRFDKQRRFTSMLDAAGGATARRLDTYGNVTAIEAPAGRNATYRYDRRSRVVRVEINGRGTGIVYDARVDKPALITDALGATTALRYDERGNLLSVTDALGNRTSYQYDKHGLAHSVTGPAGELTQLVYNRAGQPLSVTDGAGHTRCFDYDVDGKLLRETDAHGNTTCYTYDAAGRLATVLRPGGASERYDYDALGRLTACTDAAGLRTSYELDVDGMPARRLDPHGAVLEYRYDGARRVTELIAGNGDAWRCTYDALDRLSEESDSAGRLTRYRYDDSGLLSAKEEFGSGAHSDATRIDTSYARDCAGQVLDKFIARGAAGGAGQLRLRFTYDELGRMTQAIGADAIVSLHYDALGRLTAEETESDGQTSALRHACDTQGERMQAVLPDGRVLEQPLRAGAQRHRPGADATLTSGIACAPLHRHASPTQAGPGCQFRYDPLGRMQAHLSGQLVTGEGAAPASAGTYQYDEIGNLVVVGDHDGDRTIRGGDLLERILAALQPQLAGGFAFDPAHGFSLPCPLAARPLAADERCDYDAHGNLTEHTVGAHTRLQAEWNAAHQLVRVVQTRDAHGEQPLVETFEYAYDPLGRRITRREAGGATRFCWHGQRLICTADGELFTPALEQAPPVSLAKR